MIDNSEATRQLSIGELDSLILKACRGAGYSWGLSQEAGRAAAWLALRGLSAAGAFVTLLQQIDTTLISHTPEVLAQPSGIRLSRAGNGLCPVMTGAMLSDFGWSGEKVVAEQVYSPLILIPFLAASAKGANAGLAVRGDGVQLVIGNDGELTSGSAGFDESQRTVEITAMNYVSESEEIKFSRRAPVSPAELQILESFAHLTYVPASDQSRSGAGAGLTDND